MENIKIEAIDLTSIAVAAEIWLKKNNTFDQFTKELEAATRLKKAMYKVSWDADAELTIKEVGI